MVNKQTDSKKKQRNSARRAFDRNQNIGRRERRDGTSIIKKKKRKRSKNKQQNDINRLIKYNRQKQNELIVYKFTEQYEQTGMYFLILFFKIKCSCVYSNL